MTANKIKVIKIVSISLIAVLILSACACGIYYVARSYNTSRGAINGGVTDGNGNDLESDKVYPMTPNMLFTSTSADSATASGGVNLSVAFTPADVFDKSVDWSVSWVNPSSAWATGKTATAYVSVTPVAEGAPVANVKCLYDFGEQIRILVVSRNNSRATASCIVDYQQRVSGATLTFKCPTNEWRMKYSDLGWFYSFDKEIHSVAANDNYPIFLPFDDCALRTIPGLGTLPEFYTVPYFSLSAKTVLDYSTGTLLLDKNEPKAELGFNSLFIDYLEDKILPTAVNNDKCTYNSNMIYNMREFSFPLDGTQNFTLEWYYCLLLRFALFDIDDKSFNAFDILFNSSMFMYPGSRAIRNNISSSVTLKFLANRANTLLKGWAERDEEFAKLFWRDSDGYLVSVFNMSECIPDIGMLEIRNTKKSDAKFAFNAHYNFWYYDSVFSRH